MSSSDQSTAVQSPRSNSKGDGVQKKGSKSSSKSSASPQSLTSEGGNTDSTIFKQAWNLLHNVCDGLSQPVTLVRPNLSKMDVKKLDSIRNLLSGNPDSRGTTPPLNDQVGPDNEVWLNSTTPSKENMKCPSLPPRPPTRKNHSLNANKSDTGTMPIPEKKSSNGINCILDIDDGDGEVNVRKGTHRSNQNESSAQEYQQLLDGVKPFYPFLTGDPLEKTRPKASQQAAKFLDFNYSRPASYMQGLRASNTTMVPKNIEQQRMIQRTVSKDYLENINSQLSRINSERHQRDCQFQQSNSSQRIFQSNEQSQSSFGQNNNVNISLTLALGQVQQNGQITPSAEPIQVQCSNGGEQVIPRSVIIDGRIQKQKVETSMQTDYDEEMDQNHNTNRPVVRLDKDNFRRMSTLEQTSNYPSRIPSQAENYKTRRPSSYHVAAANFNGPTGWPDIFDVPSVFTYTGESIKAILNVADSIVSNFIIPPDNNMFTQAEMNAGEDQIAISLMRLVGIPQQLRHQIYQEALQDIQAIQDISSGSLDVLNCVIDWLTHGDTGGREELINKARILATITSEVDPDSEVWTQFERDVSIFSMAVGEVVKEGIDQAAETTRRCSQTLLTKITKSLSNTSLLKRSSSVTEKTIKPNPSNNGSGSLTKIVDKLPAIKEESSDHSIFEVDDQDETGTSSSVNSSSISASTKDTSVTEVPHSSTSLGPQKPGRLEKVTPVRMTCSSAERGINIGLLQEAIKNEDPNRICKETARKLADAALVGAELLLEAEIDATSSSTDVAIPETQEKVIYPDLDGNNNVQTGNKDKRNRKLRPAHKKADETKIQRECRRFARTTTESVHAAPVDSNEEINLNLCYESSDEYLPALPPRRKHDAFLDADDPSMYADFGIVGVLSSAAQSISSTFRNLSSQSISNYFPSFKRKSGPTPETSQTGGVSIVELENEPLEEAKSPSRKDSNTITGNSQVLTATSSQALEPPSQPQSSTVFKKAESQTVLPKHSEVPEEIQTPIHPQLNSSTLSRDPEGQVLLKQESEVREENTSESPQSRAVPTPQENQLPKKIQDAMAAAAKLLFDSNNNEIPITKAQSEAPIQAATPVIPPRRRLLATQVHKNNSEELNVAGPQVERSKAKNFFENLNVIDEPKSGVFIKGGCNTPEQMMAQQIRFGIEQNKREIKANEHDTNSAPAVISHPASGPHEEPPVYEEDEVYSDYDDESEAPSGIMTPVKPSSVDLPQSKLSSGDVSIADQASEFSQLLAKMKPYWPQKMVSNERPHQAKPKNSRFVPNESLPSIEESDAEITAAEITDTGDESKMHTDLSALEKIVKNLCGEVGESSGAESGTHTPQKPMINNSPYVMTTNAQENDSGLCTPQKPSIIFAGSRSSIMDVDGGKEIFAPSKIPRRNINRPVEMSTTQYLNPNNASTISIYPPKRISGLHSSSVAISNPLTRSPLALSNPRISSHSQGLISQTRTTGRRQKSSTQTVEVINVVPLISSTTPRPQLACTSVSSGIPVRGADSGSSSRSSSYIAPAVNKMSYSQILQQKKQYMTKATAKPHPTYNVPMRATNKDRNNNNYNNNSRITTPRITTPRKPQNLNSGTGPFLVLQEKKPRAATPGVVQVNEPSINSYRDYHGSQQQQQTGVSRSRPAGQYR